MGSRILIVGGGIGGVATAWSLARRSAEGVLLVERERQLGAHATAQNAAILRTPTPDLLVERLSREGAAFLRAPPAGFSDVPLVDPVGLVITSAAEPAPGSWLERLARRADVQQLSPAGLRARAPHLGGRARRAWWLADEGRLDNAALLQGFERGARAGGVRFACGTGVREILVDGGRVRGARLDDGAAIEAERVVIAAGGWAQGLGRRAGSKVELRPTRRHLLVTGVDARIDPRWPVVWCDGEDFYCRPESGGMMLCACDEEDVDPDALATDAGVRELILRKAARNLPGLADLAAAHFWAGVRTLTDDGRFVVGPDPDVAGLFWCAGLGGHGMTASAAIGRIAAELVLDRPSDEAAAAALSPARFAAPARG